MNIIKYIKFNNVLQFILLFLTLLIIIISVFIFIKHYRIFNNIESYDNNSNIENNTNNIKTCFIITGFLEKKYVDKLLETYKDVSDKIISTWNDQDNELINILKSNNFIIVQTEKPTKEISSTLQSIAIMNGINKAKELGFTHAIKIRADVECNNIILFKNIIINKYLLDSKLSCLTGIESYYGIYYLDFIICGSLDNLTNLFINVNDTNERSDFPEQFWAKSYLKTTESLTREDIKNIFNFFINDCKENNISFKWVKTDENIINEYYYVKDNGFI